MGRGKDGTEVRTNAESEEYICKRGGGWFGCSASLSFISSRTSLDGRDCKCVLPCSRGVLTIVTRANIEVELLNPPFAM
jgi:hypothetical protein